MTGYQPLDISVIYSDDGRASLQVRRKATAGTISPSRLAACLTLLVSAGWLCVVWFPAHAYLHKCLLFKAPFALPANLDLNRLIFGGPPPVNLAIRGPAEGAMIPPEDGDPESGEKISAYHSGPERGVAAAALVNDPAERRQHLLSVVYCWLGLMTVVGLAIALAGGAGASGWIRTPQAVRPVRILAALVALILAWVTYRCWPSASEAPAMDPNGRLLFAVGFALCGGLLAAGSTPHSAARTFVIGLLLFGVVSWMAWGHYELRLPEIAQRVGALFLMALAVMLGASLRRWAPSMHNLAVGLVLLAAIATTAGLYYGQRIGGFVGFSPSSATYGKALALHALALLPILWGRLAAK